MGATWGHDLLLKMFSILLCMSISYRDLHQIAKKIVIWSPWQSCAIFDVLLVCFQYVSTPWGWNLWCPCFCFSVCPSTLGMKSLMSTLCQFKETSTTCLLGKEPVYRDKTFSKPNWHSGNHHSAVSILIIKL